MKPKIVFDTTVYVAAALNQAGFADNLLDRAARGEFEVYVSAAILDELRAKLTTKFKFEAFQISQVIDKIIDITTLVYPVNSVQSPKLRDQNDLHILACATAVNADLIITSDKDLLHLKQFQSIKIAHPNMMKFWYK